MRSSFTRSLSSSIWMWLLLIVMISTTFGQEDGSLSERCGEKEYNDTRAKYEACASNKIREITTRIKASNKSGEVTTDKDSVCSAVQQLIHDCGDELGWCFTEEQVAETKRKQRAGLEVILSERYEGSSLDLCFDRAKPVIPTLEPATRANPVISTLDLVSKAEPVVSSLNTSVPTNPTHTTEKAKPTPEQTQTSLVKSEVTADAKSSSEVTTPAELYTTPVDLYNTPEERYTTPATTEKYSHTTPITTANSVTHSYKELQVTESQLNLQGENSEVNEPHETPRSQQNIPQSPKSDEFRPNVPREAVIELQESSTERLTTQRQINIELTTDSKKEAKQGMEAHTYPSESAESEPTYQNYPTNNVPILLSTSNGRVRTKVPEEASDIRTNIPQQASDILTNIPQEPLETQTSVPKPTSEPVRQPRRNALPFPKSNANTVRCPSTVVAVCLIYIYFSIA